ncbi:MAG: DUF3810 family protein [Clostridia bacterium]|nr:DUF3810 family protein [Clostridia bacterium]
MKNRAPLFFFCAAVAVLTAGVSPSPRAADALCRVLSDPLRRLLAFVTGIIPFPLFEAAVLSLPLLLLLAVLLVRRRGLSALSSRAVAFSGVVFSLYLLLSVVPARRFPPADPSPPSAEDFASFALWLAERANDDQAALQKTDGEGTPPARESVSELSAAVCETLAASRLCPTVPLRVKRTLFPGLLRRLGLLGYHAALTGEAVIDPSAPAYTLPFTAAHEAAHQAGLLSEGEASYAAYLALINSPDPALRYAGTMGALDAVLPHLPRAAQTATVAALAPCAREDLSLFDGLLPPAGSGAADGGNAAAVRLREGGSSASYDLFPVLACRRYLSLTRDAATPPAIY